MVFHLTLFRIQIPLSWTIPLLANPPFCQTVHPIKIVPQNIAPWLEKIFDSDLTNLLQIVSLGTHSQNQHSWAIFLFFIKKTLGPPFLKPSPIFLSYPGPVTQISKRRGTNHKLFQVGRFFLETLKMFKYNFSHSVNFDHEKDALNRYSLSQGKG